MTVTTREMMGNQDPWAVTPMHGWRQGLSARVWHSHVLDRLIVRARGDRALLTAVVGDPERYGVQG